MKKIKIDIPTPCHENWENMTPTEKGRFCANCQKEVIDFTRMSEREIARKFEDDNQVCGRFNSCQLGKELIVENNSAAYFPYQAIAAGMLLLTFHSIAWTQTELNTRTEIVGNSGDTTILSSPSNLPTQEIQVLDWQGKPIYDLFIMPFSTLKSKNIYSTDRNGTIYLNDLQLDSITKLELFTTKSIFITSLTEYRILSKNLVIQLTEEQSKYLLSNEPYLNPVHTVGVVVVTKEGSRLNRKFKRKNK